MIVGGGGGAAVVGAGVHAGAAAAGADQDAAERATVVGAEVAGAAVVPGATVTNVVRPARSGSARRPGSVTSAPATGTTLADEPEDHMRSSSISGAHTMVATTANVRVRCEDEGVEDRTDAFGRG